VKIDKRELLKLPLLALLSAPPIAFATFVFVFPNVSTPSIEKSLPLAMLVGLFGGIPSGYYMTRTSTALVSVIVGSIAGYIFALVLYSTPYLLYDIELILPEYYYGMFFRFTIVLLLIYMFVGFVGAVMGQLLRGLRGGGETSTSFEERPQA
jgi:fructose-specific phosphotransferase system IIC component